MRMLFRCWKKISRPCGGLLHKEGGAIIKGNNEEILKMEDIHKYVRYWVRMAQANLH